VYPDVNKQPFTEKTEVGFNNYWTSYGTNKIEAEDILTSRIPDAFILRPAYIYGPYNNAYREAFVFDCAKNKRPFYLPKTGEMKLQFIHMHDICRLVDSLLTNQPEQKIYNVGNEETPSIKEWVSMCYEIVGETPEFIEVMDDISPLKYFSFADYQYLLNVDHQMEIIKTTIDFKEGLKESWAWYQNNENLVNKRDYQLFIDENLA
jgi:nucleoside-diphosphate-sugar epimerase